MNAAATRRAIVDIGSNSIRLVVFGGPPRAPVVLFNEKLMAGLGRGVIATGELSAGSIKTALKGLARFALLLREMDVGWCRVVATAAVREAANGPQFLERIAALGLAAELLDGDAEALAAGYGVLCAIPGADGLVADLGGGSLELVRVRGGAVGERLSLPLGVLRIAALRAAGPDAVRKKLAAALKDSRLGGTEWLRECAGLSLYLVGGSWRALARVHQFRSGYPLAVLGNYAMPPQAIRPLEKALRDSRRTLARSVPGIGSGRAELLGDAATILSALTARVAPASLVTCAFGLREGLLFEALDQETRARDPLLDGVRHAVDPVQAFADYPATLLRWLDPLFGALGVAERRLIEAVAHLRGTGWESNPDFRAADGAELALHGQWIGVDGRDRALMAQALYIALGGRAPGPPILVELASPADLARAGGWGHAMRLAQSLSGGAPAVLERTTLRQIGDTLELHLPGDFAPLANSSLARRSQRLANALSLRGAEIRIG